MTKGDGKKNKDRSVVVSLTTKTDKSSELDVGEFSKNFVDFAKDIVEFELNHLSNDKKVPETSVTNLQSLQSKSILSVVRSSTGSEHSDINEAKASVTDLLSRKNNSGENT